MLAKIYVQLLDEGVKVYRPVQAVWIEKDIYQIQGVDDYDPEDESWEFVPGTYVLVAKEPLGGEMVLVARKEIKMHL